MANDFHLHAWRQADDKFGKPGGNQRGIRIDDFDEEDEECFYQVLVEEQRQKRATMGIVGWWPIYEFRERILNDDEFAREFLIVLAILFGLAIAGVWSFVRPWWPA